MCLTEGTELALLLVYKAYKYVKTCKTHYDFRALWEKNSLQTLWENLCSLWEHSYAGSWHYQKNPTKPTTGFFWDKSIISFWNWFWEWQRALAETYQLLKEGSLKIRICNKMTKPSLVYRW